MFNRIFAALAAKGGKPDQLMIDATHLKAHRTAASRLGGGRGGGSRECYGGGDRCGGRGRHRRGRFGAHRRDMIRHVAKNPPFGIALRKRRVQR